MTCRDAGSYTLLLSKPMEKIMRSQGKPPSAGIRFDATRKPKSGVPIFNFRNIFLGHILNFACLSTYHAKHGFHKEGCRAAVSF